MIRRPSLPLLLALIVLFAARVDGIEGFSLQIGDLEGPGLKARDIVLALEISANGLAGRISVGSLEWEGRRSSDVSIRCGTVAIGGGRVRCGGARYSLQAPELDAPGFTGDISIPMGDGPIELDLRGLAMLGGEVAVAGRVHGRDADLRVRGTGLSLSRAMAAEPELFPEAFWSGDGYLDGDLDADLRVGLQDGELRRVAGRMEVAGMGFSDETGLLASEGLEGRAELELDARSGSWRGPVSLAFSAGGLFVQPGFLSDGVYLDLAAHPLTLSGDVLLDGMERLELASMRLEHRGVVAGEGRFVQDLVGDTATLVLTRFQGELPSLYRIWVEPFYYGTSLARLQTEGRVSGAIDLEAGDLRSIILELDGVTVVATDGRFELYALDGPIRWAADGEPRESDVRWDSGQLFGLRAGAGRVRLAASGDDLQLLDPSRTPILDGALKLDRLAIRDLRGEDPSFLLQLELEPIDLGELSRALSWPELGGRLSARIPELSYTAGQLALGGRLEADIFDGRIEVENLRIRDPFGVLPRIRGDVRIRRLDLDSLTGTFALGSISGRLDGEILGLRMAGDEALAFDAKLYTSPEDPGERRISQRAIESLSSIGGGGVGDRLSRGFLRTFKSFGYEKLGIRCVLKDELCRMGGVERAEGDAYYLVKGRGLPRIDVVGDREWVDWPALEAKLKEWALAAAEEVE